jgi:hypothetical protein
MNLGENSKFDVLNDWLVSCCALREQNFKNSKTAKLNVLVVF